MNELRSSVFADAVVNVVAERDAALARVRDLENSVCRLDFERDEARRQRDALLEAIKPMRFAPATRHERRLMEMAEAAIKSAEGGVDFAATNCPRCHGTGKKA